MESLPRLQTDINLLAADAMALSGGPTSAAHSVTVGEGLQFLSGCWKVASATYHVTLYTGEVDCLLLLQLTFLHANHPREGKAAAAEPRRHALTCHAGFHQSVHWKQGTNPVPHMRRGEFGLISEGRHIKESASIFCVYHTSGLTGSKGRMESAKLPLSSGLLSLTLTSSHTDSPPPPVIT